MRSIFFMSPCHRGTKKGMYMKKVDNFTDLKEIKAVSWSVRENADGDCSFSPDRVAVRFEDDSGQYWEIPIQFCLWTEEEAIRYEGIAGAMLNLIFSKLGITGGKWIGYDCTISEAVNHARAELRKEPSEEHTHFFRKQYIF